MASGYRYYRNRTILYVFTIVCVLGLLSVTGANASEGEERRGTKRLSQTGIVQLSGTNRIDTRFSGYRHAGNGTGLVKAVNTEFVASVTQEWINEEWEDAERALHVLDNLQRLIEETIQHHQNDSWQNFERHLLEYEAESENLSIEITQDWEDGDWEHKWRDQYTYDEQDRLIELLWEDWDEDEWIQTDRFLFSYDGDGNLEEVLIYWWTGDAWDLDYREIWSYDDDGNLVQILEEVWDGNEWWEDFRVLFAYDGEGNRIESTYQAFEDDEWENVQLVESEYDDGGNVVQSVYSQWEDNDWVPVWRDTFEFDANDVLTSELIELWTGTAWENWMRITYTDSPTRVADEGGMPRRFELAQNYPNPFNPSTTIRFTIPEQTNVTLTVYDMLGREVATLVDEILQPGEHTKLFDAGHLASGVYVYRIRAGDFTDTKRLVLMK